MIYENFKDSNKELVASLSAHIAAQLKTSRALFVSGGSTPVALFQSLSLHRDIPWHDITVCAVDERWLPMSDKDSNAKLIHEHLLVNVAASARFFDLYDPNSTPEQAARLKDREVSDLLSRQPVIILGMGEDSHTASIFPNLANTAAVLDFSRSDMLAVMRPESAPYTRITLSAAAIARASHLYLHIQGQKKRDVYNQARVFAQNNSNDFCANPIAAFIAAPQLELHVFSSR